MHRPNTLQAARPQRGAFPSPSKELPPDSSAQPAGPRQAPALAPAQRPLRITPAVPGAGGAWQEGLQSRSGQEEGSEGQESEAEHELGPWSPHGLPGTMECPAP